MRYTLLSLLVLMSLVSYGQSSRYRSIIPLLEQAPVPTALDTLWYDTFDGADLSNYTNAGSSGIALDGTNDELDFSGSFNNFVKHLQFSKSDNPHRTTMLSEWTQILEVRTPVSLTGAFGGGVGIKSRNTWSGNDFHIIARWAWDENNVYFYQDDVIGGSQVIKSTGFTVVANTSYLVFLTKNRNTFTYTVKDITNTTTHFSVTYNTMLTSTAGVNNFSNNVGRFCLWNFQGNFSVMSWTITSPVQKNIDDVWLGDSNSAGRYAGTEGNRFAISAFTNVGATFEVMAGGGDRATELLLFVDEVIALFPKRVWICIGRNDVASGQSSGTWQANIASLISQFEAEGIQVILVTPIASNVDVTGVRTYMLTFSGTNDIVDIYTESVGVGTALRNDWDAGDDIHLNSTGNTALGTYLESVYTY